MGFGSNISTSMFWGLLINFKLSSWFIFIFLWLVQRLALSNGLDRKRFLHFRIVGYTQPIRRPPSIQLSLYNLCKISLMTPKATHTEYDKHYSYRNFIKTSSLWSLYGAKSLKPISCKYDIPFTWGRKRLHLLNTYCTSYGLNMFRALLCPSSEACDYDVDYHIGRFFLGLL